MKINDEFKPKKINFFAAEKMLEGVEEVARVVGSTMGPHGRTVISEVVDARYPKATKDGVSVAKQIVLKDQIKDLGAQLVIQAAERQVRETGDGTTLACVLAYAFFKFGLEEITNGKSAREVIEDIDSDLKKVYQEIKKKSVRCKTIEMLEKVATVSANCDNTIGKVIAEAVYTLGDNGVIEAIRTADHGIKLTFEDGYQYASGVDFKDFLTTEKSLILKNPMVLVTNRVLHRGSELLPIVKKINKEPSLQGRTLCIIAPDVVGEMFTVIMGSLREGKAFIPFIKPVGIGIEQQFCLEDIAALTGATLIKSKGGIRPEDIELSDLGKCDILKSHYKKSTSIIVKNKRKIKDRLSFLKKLKLSDHCDYDAAVIQRSIAKLSGGVALIEVGGTNETEQNEIYDRVEDSILAARAAHEKGIVNGGGVELWNCRNLVGDSIVGKSIMQPLLKIVENWDIKLQPEYRSEGYNGNGWTGESMIQMGIIDPTKVILTALKNASSVAKLMLNSSATITLDEV